jgi:hypothetical protein
MARGTLMSAAVVAALGSCTGPTTHTHLRKAEDGGCQSEVAVHSEPPAPAAGNDESQGQAHHPQQHPQ